jgi:hypothetical protein
VALAALPEDLFLYMGVFLRTRIANLAVLLRSALFWDIMQRCVVKDYHMMLHDIPEERRAYQHCSGSPKS